MTTPEPLPRWKLVAADGSDSYIFHINPREADSAFDNDQSITWFSRGGYGYANGGHGYQYGGLRNPKQPQNWSFTGIVMDQDQHDKLLDWSRRSGLVYLMTDLGELLKVRLLGIKFTRKAPVSPRQPLRQEYTMNALVYEYGQSGNLTFGTTTTATSTAAAGTVLIDQPAYTGATSTTSVLASPGRVGTSTITGYAGQLNIKANAGTVTIT